MTLNLFSPTFGGPRGLQYQEDFISVEEEAALINEIQSLALQPFQFGAYQGKRRVASFGWRYDYGERRLEKAADVPEWLQPFLIRTERSAAEGSAAISQVLCTEYEPGAGIGWHRDKPHFGNVYGLSLVSPCQFRFRRPLGKKWERFTLEIQPRSLYMLAGEARHAWEHSIPAVESMRYSITFRTLAGA